MTTLYDINVQESNGSEVSMAQFEGNVLLIVNTATRCGLAPQYKGLQSLYEKFQNQGFYVLDFPSNQFLQTPHTNEEINEFCDVNYQTTFPRFAKININGDNAAPLYKFLRSEQGGVLGSAIKWNFTKFLVDRNGTIIKRYAPTVLPKEIEEDIKSILN